MGRGLELPDAVSGCDEGLLERIDPSILAPAPDGTPAREDFFREALQNCAIGYNVWANVIAYDSRRFGGDRPSILADFFDLERFPGRRGMQRRAQINLEWALLADGVPPDQVYDQLLSSDGRDRAFRVLSRILPDVVWWTRGSDPPQLLASRRVAMSTAWNGRIYEAVQERGADIEIIWDGQIWNMDAWTIPRGTENLEEALGFVRFATEPERLAAQASMVAYGPARRSSHGLIPDAVKPHLPTAEPRRDDAFRIDYRWWARHGDVIAQSFEDWLAPKLTDRRREGH